MTQQLKLPSLSNVHKRLASPQRQTFREAIRREADHLARLLEVSASIDMDPSADSPEVERRDVVGTFVQAKEIGSECLKDESQMARTAGIRRCAPTIE